MARLIFLAVLIIDALVILAVIGPVLYWFIARK